MNNLDSIKTFYDREAANYVSSRYVGESSDAIIWRLRRELTLAMVGASPGCVVDVAAGPAVLAPDLTSRARHAVYADLALGMMVEGKRQQPDALASWLNCDLGQLPVAAGCVDTLVVLGVFGLVRDADSVLEEFSRVLRLGGHLVLQFPSARNIRRVAVSGLQFLGRRHGRRYEQRLTDASIRPAPYSLSNMARLLRTHRFEVDDWVSYDFRLPFLSAVSNRVDAGVAMALQRRWSRSARLGQTAEGILVSAHSIEDE